MKRFLIVLAAGALFACQSADDKTSAALTQEQKDQAARDSANFTTIEWLDSTVKDLGQIKDGQVVEVSYRFKNTGDKPLIIAGVTASCGCTVPEKPEKPIAPGQEDVIKAKFDSKNRPKGENRKDIFVTANTKPQGSMQLSFKVVITE